MQTVIDLSSACLRATGSALTLVEHGRAWDGEILMRSVLEGTLKYVYLVADPVSFAVRHREYTEVLQEVGFLKDHYKAKALLEAVPNPQDSEWKPFKDLVMSAAAIEDVQSRYPRRESAEIERRWGFTGLVAALADSRVPAAEFVKMLLQPYSTASHVHHMDFIGISVVMEREERRVKRRQLVHKAHSARLISDAFLYEFFRLLITFRFFEIDPAPVFAERERFQALSAELSLARSEWEAAEYEENGKP